MRIYFVCNINSAKREIIAQKSTPRNLFIIVKEGANRLKELSDRLEPNEKTVSMDKSEAQKEVSSCWRALADDIRTYWEGKNESEKVILSSILLGKDNDFNKYINTVHD